MIHLDDARPYVAPGGEGRVEGDAVAVGELLCGRRGRTRANEHAAEADVGEGCVARDGGGEAVVVLEVPHQRVVVVGVHVREDARARIWGGFRHRGRRW